MFRSQITSQTNAPVYICKKCFTNFTKKELFDKHIQYCLRNETVAVKMPEKITLLNSKIIPIDFRYLLLFMQTLNVLQNHLKHVSLLPMNLIRIRIKNKSEFYSKLNDEHISDEDYQHALTVWETFKCKTIKDFHDLYLKSDVLLLADVFENFRKVCLKHYKLDPVHYFTAPGLTWDACLKKTKQNYSFFTIMTCWWCLNKDYGEGGTHIAKKYEEANNKYMRDYDSNKRPKYIQYLDANNLYGCAMSRKLPAHGLSGWRI